MAKKRKAQTAQAAPRRRMYQGAQFSRLTADWVTSNTSADSEVYGSAQKLRDRARQLCRDNDYARQALRAIEGNVIGQGIPFQSQVRMQRGGKLDTGINDAIEAAWKRWSYAQHCHTGGKLCFADIERLVIRACAESGALPAAAASAPASETAGSPSSSSSSSAAAAAAAGAASSP